MLKKIQKFVYRLIKKYRVEFMKKLLDSRGADRAMLDIGCQDLQLYHLIKDRYDITLGDIAPKNKLITKEDIQSLSFKDKSFDIVLCQEVLEHVPNPIKAIAELKRVAKNKLIITIPYEPFFTLFRLGVWEKEHLWAIAPEALKYYLGQPEYEKKVFFKRYYVGILNINQ